MDKPTWNSNARQASLRKWADNLHKEAKRVFLADKTHAHLLFLFNQDNGCISVNPVPPKTDSEHLDSGIKGAVSEHSLYGVIFIGEAWVYVKKGPGDHTAFQLADGEMKVSDLNKQDRTECLYMRVESKDECFLHINPIHREGDSVQLGSDKTLRGEEKHWF